MEGLPDCGDEIEIAVIGLTGDLVAALRLLPTAKVREIKRLVFESQPTAAPSWQQLFLEGRELQDGEVAESFVLPLSSEDDAPVGHDTAVFIQLVIVVDLHDLVHGPHETALEVAASLDALGEAAEPYVASFLGDMEQAAIITCVQSLSERLNVAGDFSNLKAAFRPHVFEVLASTGPQPRGRRRCWKFDVLSWLGPNAVPHLVSWLAHLERPLLPQWRRCAELLRSYPDSPRVCLAAKSALSDRGGPSVARVDELAQLRRSLGRNIACAAPEERWTLEDLRNRAFAALCDLHEHSADCKVRYAAARALKY